MHLLLCICFIANGNNILCHLVIDKASEACSVVLILYNTGRTCFHCCNFLVLKLISLYSVLVWCILLLFNPCHCHRCRPLNRIPVNHIPFVEVGCWKAKPKCIPCFKCSLNCIQFIELFCLFACQYSINWTVDHCTEWPQKTRPPVVHILLMQPPFHDKMKQILLKCSHSSRKVVNYSL